MKKIRDIFSGNEGFTLIELLIVIVIIGVLAAIAVPNIAGLGEGADFEAVRANMRTLMVEIESFRAQHPNANITITDTASGTDFDISFDDGTDTFTSGAIASLNEQEISLSNDSSGDTFYNITAEASDANWSVNISDGSITTSGN